MELSFQPLPPEERRWIDERLAQAAELVRRFAPDAEDPESTLEGALSALDAAFAAFMESEEPGYETEEEELQAEAEAQEVVQAVAAAFGEALVQSLGFEWGMASDEYGVDRAVRALPGRGDVTLFPADFIASRYERRETGFLVAAVEEVGEHLQEVTAEWEGS